MVSKKNPSNLLPVLFTDRSQMMKKGLCVFIAYAVTIWVSPAVASPCERGRPYIENNTLVTDQGSRIRGSTFWLYGWMYDKIQFAKSETAWKNFHPNRLNAVRLACAYRPDHHKNLSLDQYENLLDDLIDRAAKKGIYVLIDYHYYPGSYSMSGAKDFWNRFAPRYADRSHVIYELANEPVSWAAKDFRDHHLRDFEELWRICDRHAPKTPIVILSFANVGYDGATPRQVADRLQGIDWNKTLVGFHTYWRDNSSRMQDLKKGYPVVCTEFMDCEWHETKPLDGVCQHSVRMEQLGISWWQWEIMETESEMRKTMPRMVQGNKNAGTWWKADDYDACGESAPVPQPSKPQITNNPDSKTIEEGQSATFAVSASGDNLRYQWQRNGAAISGANGSRYTITNASVSLNGSKYRCTVSNSGGSVTSSEATLRVNAKANEPTQPVNPPSTPSAGNVLKNGDFSSGTNTWTLYTFDGGRGSMNVSGGVLELDVSKPGPNAWSIQLVQNGVELDNGATYTLKATMRADQSHAIKLGVGQNYSPWSIYGGGYTKATLGGAWKTLTKTFTMNRKDDRARVVFDFGASATGAIYLSEVVLTRDGDSSAPADDDQTAQPSQPSEPAQPSQPKDDDDAVISGLAAPSNVTLELVSATRMIIKWKDNADNEQGFEIERSDNGGAFTPINTRGLNAERYADNTVQSGKKYAYRVRAYNRDGVSNYSAPAAWGDAPIPSGGDSDDNTGGSQPAPTPSPTPTPTAGNLVPNGDFSAGTSGWALYTHNDTKGSIQASGGDLIVNVNRTGTQHWHVQLINDGVTLREGQKYTLTVVMKSSENRTAKVGVSKNYSPWSAYGGLSKVSLSSRWNTLTKTFTADKNDDRARIEIDFGEGPAATITIGEVKLEPVQSALGKVGIQSGATSMLHMELREDQQDVSVRILDMRGRLIGNYTSARLGKGAHALPLVTKRLPHGLYIMSFESAEICHRRSLPIIK